MTKEVVLQMIWDRHFDLGMEKDIDDACEDIYNEVFVPLLVKARKEVAKEIYISTKYYFGKQNNMLAEWIKKAYDLDEE